MKEHNFFIERIRHASQRLGLHKLRTQQDDTPYHYDTAPPVAYFGIHSEMENDKVMFNDDSAPNRRGFTCLCGHEHDPIVHWEVRVCETCNRLWYSAGNSLRAWMTDWRTESERKYDDAHARQLHAKARRRYKELEEAFANNYVKIVMTILQLD